MNRTVLVIVAAGAALVALLAALLVVGFVLTLHHRVPTLPAPAPGKLPSSLSTTMLHAGFHEAFVLILAGDHPRGPMVSYSYGVKGANYLAYTPGAADAWCRSLVLSWESEPAFGGCLNATGNG